MAMTCVLSDTPYVIPQRRRESLEEEAKENEEMERLFREVFNMVCVKVPRFSYIDIFQSKYDFAHFWLSFAQNTDCRFARLSHMNVQYYKEEMFTLFNTPKMGSLRTSKQKGLVTVVYNTEKGLWLDEHHKDCEGRRFECREAFDGSKVVVEQESPFCIKACKSVYHPSLIMDFTRHLRERIEARYFEERDSHKICYLPSSTVSNDKLEQLHKLELLSIACWKSALLNFRLPLTRCQNEKCRTLDMGHLLDFYH